MVNITEVLEVQNEETKEVVHFAVGDVAVFAVTDHTVEGGIVKVTGAIDVIHRVDRYVVVDSSTQFHSETRRLELSKIVSIEKYVAPAAAAAVVTPVVTTPVATPVVTAPVAEAAPTIGKKETVEAAVEPNAVIGTNTETVSVKDSNEKAVASDSTNEDPNITEAAPASASPTPMA